MSQILWTASTQVGAVLFALRLVDTRLNGLTKSGIGCAMRVHQELGSGFSELLHQRGLAVGLKEEGVVYQREINSPVFYKRINIGAQRTDFVLLINFGEASLKLKRFLHNPSR